jgi:hypothetical protein
LVGGVELDSPIPTPVRVGPLIWLRPVALVRCGSAASLHTVMGSDMGIVSVLAHPCTPTRLGQSLDEFHQPEEFFLSWEPGLAKVIVLSLRVENRFGCGLKFLSECSTLRARGIVGVRHAPHRWTATCSSNASAASRARVRALVRASTTRTSSSWEADLEVRSSYSRFAAYTNTVVSTTARPSAVRSRHSAAAGLDGPVTRRSYHLQLPM